MVKKKPISTKTGPRKTPPRTAAMKSKASSSSQMARSAGRSATLLVRFGINLEDLELPEAPRRPHGPLFHRWLPDGESDAIHLQTGINGTSLKVWFERFGCVRDGMVSFKYGVKLAQSDLIPRHGVLDAGPLLGLCEVQKPSAVELSVLRRSRTESREYNALRKKVATKIIQPCVNRFLSIIRSTFGQYWIRELHVWDSQKESLGNYCSMLNLRWSLDGGATWSDFVPETPTVYLTSTVRQTFDEYMTKDDWDDLAEILNSGYEPSQGCLLLMQAHRSKDQGDTVYAFVEGVTALEVAIAEAVRRNVTSKALTHSIQSFWTLKLPAQLALIASIAADVTHDDIEHAATAVGIRNKIVHDGKKPSANADKHLAGLFRTVAALLSGPTCCFPSANPGNLVQPIEKWEQQAKA